MEITERENWRRQYRKYNSAYVKAAAKRRLKKRTDSWTFESARNRARRNGTEFTIKLEDLTLPTHCPVFGTLLNYVNEGQTSRDNSASLDRIDNTKGYIPGNVVIVSFRANALKKDATLDEMKKLVEFYSTIM